MKRKRALIYVVACLVCATIATVAAFRYISKVSGKGAALDTVPILLATQDIKQGELIALGVAGDQPNTAFVQWPKDMVPDSAIRDKKDLADQQWRARTAFVKHEVIQKSRLTPESEFVPPDFCWHMVKAVDEDIKSGRLRLGMKVDVLQVTGKSPASLMRCAEIRAIGRLDANGLPIIEKDPPPNVWLLVKKADNNALVEAEYGAKLILAEATDPQCTEPYLVGPGDSQQSRKKEADDMLTRAKGLAQAGQFEQALSVFDDLVNNYADVTAASTQAAVEQTKTRETFAQSLYDRAKAALDGDKNFTEALRLLDDLDRQAPPGAAVRAKASTLRTQAQAALEKHRLRVQFDALTAGLDDALKTGDLPKAKAKQAELEQFAQPGTTFDDPKPEQQPQQAAEDYAKRLKSRTSDFNIKKQAMEFFLNANNVQAARDSLAQLKDQFPAHPDLAAMEQTVQAAGNPSK